MKTALAILLVSLAPMTALADEEPTSGPAEPAEPPATMVAPAPPPPAPAPVPVEKGRFRWGIAGGGGTFIPGPLVNFGAEGRVGWQFNNLFGLSLAFGAQGGIGFGARITESSVGVSVSAVSFWHVGVDAEAMFGNVFFVAGGPRLVRGGWASVSESVSSSGAVEQTALAVGGWMPGFDVKLGFGFGKPKASGRRNNFTIALDTMFLFAPNGAYVTQEVDSKGNVIQEVRTTRFALGIAPMLMFGFEMR